MNTIDAIEQKIIVENSSEFINILIQMKIILNTTTCPECEIPMKLESKKGFIKDHSWRFSNKKRLKRNKRFSVLHGTFSAEFGESIRKMLRALLRYAGRKSRFSICSTLSLSRPTFRKLIQKLINLMEIENVQIRKLGGAGVIIQADETMLNFKNKSHRGRLSDNRTGALCIVQCSSETGSFQKVWAQVIPNKQANTIIPMICDRILLGSVIHTDEHRSYSSLAGRGFLHNTVCHKYNFVDVVTGVHTQAVEIFNNELKWEIKARKGVKTSYRTSFLPEFVWK